MSSDRKWRSPAWAQAELEIDRNGMSRLISEGRVTTRLRPGSGRTEVLASDIRRLAAECVQPALAS
jgi:hypothetical protein